MKGLEKKYGLLIESHDGAVLSLAITHDNKYVVSGGDNTIRVWNLQEERQESILEGHSTLVWSLAITHDSKYVASGSYMEIIVWNLQKRCKEGVLEGHKKLKKNKLCLNISYFSNIIL